MSQIVQAVQLNQFPVFEQTEQTSNGGKLFVANAAGLVQMKRLIDAMVQQVDTALREGRLDVNDMLRMQTVRFITNPARNEPWKIPAHYAAIALTDPLALPDRLMDQVTPIVEAHL